MFESFSGVGMQAMAFKRLGINYDHVGISEIDKDAIISYAAIHCDLENIYKATESFPTKEDMIESLQLKNVGYDYVKGKHTVTTRMPYKRLKLLYLADQLSKNKGDISIVKACDINEQLDVFTHSFPCQSLSYTGTGGGLDSGKSSVVWEVVRLLKELSEESLLPKSLIMENVIGLLGKKYKPGFQRLLSELSKLGYANYYQVMNAKDYGVAQNRRRVIMVSVLGDYSYEFPKPFKLTKTFKDYLEKDVSDKYLLSENMYNFFLINDKNNREKGNGFRFKPHDPDVTSVAFAITTKAGNRMDDNFVIIDDMFKNRDIRTYDDYAPTIRSERSGLKVSNGVNVRKLTELEVWRFMDVDDDDFYKAEKFSVSTKLYQQAGNGLVVGKLAYVIKEMM